MSDYYEQLIATEYEDWKEHFKVFRSVHATWNYEYFGSKKKKKEPPILNLPSELKLN